MSGKSYGAVQVTDEQDQASPEPFQPNNESNPLLTPNKPINHSTNNESNASPFLDNLKKTCFKFWSDLTFDWISPLLALGNERGQLNVEDLNTLPLPKDCETEVVYAEFLKCWEEELKKAQAGTKSALITTDNTTGKENNQGTSEESNSLEMEILQSVHYSPQHPAHYQPSLIRALYNAFGTDFLRAGLFKLVHDSNLFVGPIVLNRLIKFLRDDSAPLSDGLILVFVVTISQIVMSITLRHYFYKCYTCGLRIRTAVVIAIYKKCLLLSLKERHARGGAGEIANLVGIDAQRMQDLMTYLHAVWYSFFQIGLALYFLHKQVGLAMLAGVCVILFLIPSTKTVSSYLAKIQKRLMKARDERVALNNEVLGSMKIIKIQAWEANFRRKLLGLREAELERLKDYFFTSAVSVSLYSSTPLLVALATFAAYTLSGHDLDVAEALTALSLFDILRFPLFMLPQIINRIVEAGISFERVREFLLCEEYKSVGEGRLKENGEVWIKNGTFVYDSKKPKLPEESETKPKSNIGKLVQQNRRMMQEAMLDRQWEMVLLKAQLLDAEEKIHVLQKQVHPELLCERGYSELNQWSPSSLLSLRRVCMHAKPGQFIAVVGAVGSGKSTLINSLLGEGRPLTGTELAFKGRLGVFLQTPFIMNDTLKNNILFGHTSGTTDEERYQLAIKVCSLTHDLKMLSAGDQTEIGEKGITLSGGQKARVSLARAAYHDADIYLLDDPLAAVDAHVGKDLFNKCIVDEMLLGKSKKQRASKNGGMKQQRNATVILVTNALQYLNHPMIDKIVVLDDGCVDEVGTFAELSSNLESKFSAFLAVMAETSQVADEQDLTAEIKDVIMLDDENTCENRLDTSDEPEVAKVVEPSPPRKKSLTRKLSSTLEHEVEDSDDGGALMTDEFKERVVGSVSRKVYVDWAKAAGGLSIAVSILLLFVWVEALQVSSKWWLTHWSQSGGSANAFFYLGIYALINFSAIFFTWCRLILINFSSVRASSIMFENLLDVILHAPMSFFDTTPIGRIVNRFSKDMYTVDEQLVSSARSYLSTIMTVLSTIIVVVSVTPAFLFGLAPVVVVSGVIDSAAVCEQLVVLMQHHPFFYTNQVLLAPTRLFYYETYRELKRLDSVSRSPIYALLGETIDGVLTIRAFCAQLGLNARMVRMLDIQQNAYHLTFSAQCWLSVRLEFAGSMIVMFTCLVSVMEHRHGVDATFAGLAGLAISFALSVTQSLNWTVRMASDVEANMVGLERIQQYSKIKGEAPQFTSADDILPVDWPQQGTIDFNSVQLRYRKGLPLVLKGLSISIPARSKVGVVGRTGAGKSTLMVALLRIVELDAGTVAIDGVDIKNVGLKKLRSSIAVIPQDPVLFSGTVRTNLDPFNEFNDLKLFEVLNHVGLYDPMERVSSKSSLSSHDHSTAQKKGGGRGQPIRSLSDEVAEGGNNFSVGQRQLLVIARAMLTGAKIVIMDEATASVDADTDARIQRVFRHEFKNATCITVAHRLNTIMDSDFVLVMDDGRAAEFDKPSALLLKGGIFKGLVDAWEEEN